MIRAATRCTVWSDSCTCTVRRRQRAVTVVVLDTELHRQHGSLLRRQRRRDLDVFTRGKPADDACFIAVVQQLLVMMLQPETDPLRDVERDRWREQQQRAEH